MRVISLLFSNYTTKTTATCILGTQYNKTEALNISTCSNYHTSTETNSLLNQKQDALSSSGADAVDWFLGPTRLSKLNAGNNNNIGRNFPEPEITISVDSIIDTHVTALTNYYDKNESYLLLFNVIL